MGRKNREVGGVREERRMEGRKKGRKEGWKKGRKIEGRNEVRKGKEEKV